MGARTKQKTHLRNRPKGGHADSHPQRKVPVSQPRSCSTNRNVLGTSQGGEVMNCFSEAQRNLIERLQSEFRDLGEFQYLDFQCGFPSELSSEYVDQLILCIEAKSGKLTQLCVIAACEDVNMFEALMLRISDVLNNDEYALLTVYESGIAGRTGQESLNYV